MEADKEQEERIRSRVPYVESHANQSWMFSRDRRSFHTALEDILHCTDDDGGGAKGGDDDDCPLERGLSIRSCQPWCDCGIVQSYKK